MESKDDVITMVDVLKVENDIDEATSAVLSGSDEKKCTYSNGYVKRQALYSCITCMPADAKDNPEKAIGLCLACSLDCHEHHDLVELYTKRSFRCDCGTKGGIPCRVDPSKKTNITESSSSTSASQESASLNHYNQNFIGTYCICKRPYPDEEDEVEDEMIQCVVCEDWYHTRHLNTKIPDSKSYTEMICETCVTKNDFLMDYCGLAVQVVSDNSICESLNVTAVDDNADDENSAKKIKLSDDACIRPKNTLLDNNARTLFFKDGWRSSLCQCENCLKLYKNNKVQFLTDLEDTVLFYEEKGKDKPKTSIYDASLAALSSLNRVNQIDAITSYNRMKDKLFEFLQTFVVNNQIVTEEDVKRFFRTMKENPDNQNVHHPHFCR